MFNNIRILDFQFFINEPQIGFLRCKYYDRPILFTLGTI